MDALFDFVDNLQIPVLTKSALVELLVDRMGINTREASELVEGFFDLIQERLTKGEDVKLTGFGNFEVHGKQPRPGRNPRTGEEVEISARRVVRFLPGPKFKRRMVKGWPVAVLSAPNSRRPAAPQPAKVRVRRSGRAENTVQPAAI